ncbi:hypothetical protein [Paenibacillus mendelii]|uniref:Uncharacterized protein n=1 Tax=Paenibacillus mendelii TaxID=206163 RepID=A0ABV6JMK1_9BACL|nr:hypothetical protein [Paenibacillus mendelii]MCQ6558970.1 hypothetical protein [Paenibacillus mendelii]
MNKKVVVVTEDNSDLLQIMLARDPNTFVIKKAELVHVDLDPFDAIAILGGTADKPMLFLAPERLRIEAQIKKGKRVFAEYVASIGHVYFEPPATTRFQRLVYCADPHQINGLSAGMLIDDQCGMRLRPHGIACTHNKPILQYSAVHAHDNIEVKEEFYQSISDRALWFDDPKNLLICSFRLTPFIQARFAPKARIVHIVSFIIGWLWDAEVELKDIPFTYSSGTWNKEEGFNQQIQRCTARAMNWFERSGIVYDEGKTGVLEGIGTEIYSDGSQRISHVRRVDCIGEVALSYFLQYMLSGDERNLTVSNNLHHYIFENYMYKDRDECYGMMRWTEEAWGICYQDDVARAVIPQLLQCLYTNSRDRLDDVIAALQFLVRTTGTDGTRVFRTDHIHLNPEQMNKLRNEPGNLPSAHYNAYYYAALLLAYKLTGIESFLDTSLRGLETMMSVYPHTTREQSETQEYCRLILPLSWLYGVTGAAEHKEWLYRVTKDLQRYKHASGAYLEWDEGYQAEMRHEMGQGESSLIGQNGDPVIDLLYSNNWLPMGFIQAYFVTRDDYFLKLWEELASFMVAAQLHSGNPYIDGAWARAFDVELQEVYGSPADLGWGPWAIESGWTVAEITSGLMMGLLKDRFIDFHVIEK